MIRSVSQARWLGALSILFFVSGACGLVYQILWLRLLGLVLGVTVYAASTVWASFMGGLALGSIAGGYLGDRVKRPLMWFGAAEILIGASALASPFLLAQLSGLYVRYHTALPSSFMGLTAARAAMSCVVLLVPTLLMGMTMPMVIRSALFQRGDFAKRVGWLYGTNTAGAILGTLVAGLVFIPGLGVSATFQVAAAANLVVGLAAIGLSAIAPVRAPDATTVSAASSGDAAQPGIGARRLVLAVFALSGMASLALEVIWFRVIPLVSRPTVYTFSLVLACVLGGIAAGSYLITPFLKRAWNWMLILAVIECAIGLAALTSLNLLEYVPQWALAIEPWLGRVVPAYLAFPLAAAAPAVLPTSVLMGTAFPIGLRLWTANRRIAAGVGAFYGLNLAGAIAGSLVAGFVLLPLVGSRAALIGVAAVTTLSGLVLLLPAPSSSRLKIAVAALGVLLFAGGIAGLDDPFDAFLAVRYPNQPIIAREESVQATVTVHRYGPRLNMYIDGNHQASDTGDTVQFHRQIAQLPLAVHPQPQTMLVVGLGGGVTPGAAAVQEAMALDIVELSPAVVRASDHFRHVNYDLLRRPNVHLRIDDGRNFLTVTSRRYDVITADAIVPMLQGSNNLYSREYFQLLRRALNPGGVVSQWVCCTTSEHQAILRSFVSVFPGTTLWMDGRIAIGSVEPLRVSAEDVAWKMAFPQRRAALEALGVRTLDDFGQIYVGGPAEIRRYLGEGPMLTDDRPLAEYFLSLPRDPEPNPEAFRGDVRTIIVK